MPFQLFSFGPGDSEGQSELLALGEVQLGGTASPDVAADISAHGGGLLGVWQSRGFGGADYLIVEGEFDQADAAEVAADAGQTLVDFREIVVLGSETTIGDVREGLEALNIGPATRACTECGGYNGLHFSPPH